MEKRPGKASGRDWSKASISQETPGATGSWERQGRTLPESLPWERTVNTLISNSPPPELGENPSVICQLCGNVLWWPRKTNAQRAERKGEVQRGWRSVTVS